MDERGGPGEAGGMNVPAGDIGDSKHGTVNPFQRKTPGFLSSMWNSNEEVSLRRCR
jgi:hypothetical protein